MNVYGRRRARRTIHTPADVATLVPYAGSRRERAASVEVLG
jgi:hypothetical protein